MQNFDTIKNDKFEKTCLNFREVSPRNSQTLTEVKHGFNDVIVALEIIKQSI